MLLLRALQDCDAHDKGKVLQLRNMAEVGGNWRERPLKLFLGSNRYTSTTQTHSHVRSLEKTDHWTYWNTGYYMVFVPTMYGVRSVSNYLKVHALLQKLRAFCFYIPQDPSWVLCGTDARC